MDFSLSETQAELKALAARILSEQASQERLRTLDGKGYFDAQLWQQLAESGLLGITLSESEGGVAEDFETLCILLEEVGRNVAPLPLLDVLVTGALALQSVDSPAVNAALEALARGEAVVCAALQEPGQRELLAVETRAASEGGQWLLSGSKERVPAADQAGVCWTLARCDEGLGVFLFDLQAVGIERQAQTLTTGELTQLLTLRSVPAERLCVGADAEAFVERALLHSLAANAAVAVGVCEAMTRMAAGYTSEREQFGKPIATFQAVAHKLADCYIDTQCLRGLTEQAVSRLTQQGVSTEAREAVLAAKIFATEALHRISHASQQVHGGTGVDRDYPLFRYCLLAKKLELDFGGQGLWAQRLGAMLAA